MADFLKLLEGYLVPILVRWVLKIGGTWLALAGWGESDVVTIVGGVVAVAVGMLISLINHKTAKES